MKLPSYIYFELSIQFRQELLTTGVGLEFIALLSFWTLSSVGLQQCAQKLQSTKHMKKDLMLLKDNPTSPPTLKHYWGGGVILGGGGVCRGLPFLLPKNKRERRRTQEERKREEEIKMKKEEKNKSLLNLIPAYATD